MAKDDDSKPEEKPAAEQAQGSTVPAGTQVSDSAGAGRRVQDVLGRPVPEDEQLLEDQ
jgi:hypothetical protein